VFRSFFPAALKKLVSLEAHGRAEGWEVKGKREKKQINADERRSDLGVQRRFFWLRFWPR
jgi:hypothetical protein